MLNLLRARPLSRPRVILSLLVALAADGIQIGLGPLGWTFLDEIIDVIAMTFISLLIGFHPLLLPTFVVELVPIVDMLPTWTGCLTAVILLRRRLQPPRYVGPAPPPLASSESGKTSPIIDV